MSKLERIATFISVVDENGFAAAARKKGVSTAAVSRQVTALENELGTQLLQRTTRQLALTEMGYEYYQRSKKTLEELFEVEVLLQNKDEATGVLHVMANRYFAITHLFPKLPDFMRQNPNLRLAFQLAERFPNLEKDGIDILFGVSVEGADELVRRQVATTRYVLCASTVYLEQYGEPKTPTDLIKHHYITHSMRKPNNTIDFKDGRSIQVNPSLWLNDSYAMRECALLGMGLVNLHDYMVNDALMDGRLVEVLQKHQEPKKQIYLYYRKSRHLQPKIRRFIDFFVN